MKRKFLVFLAVGLGAGVLFGSGQHDDSRKGHFPGIREKSDFEIPGPGERTLAVVGGTIIDGTGNPPLSPGTILISGNKIVEIGPEKQVRIPPDAIRIEARDKFIIPGLMDSNVHLIISRTLEFLARQETHFEDLIEEAAQVALKHGQTTVFDTWGPLQPILNVRDRIQRGEVIGSRIFAAGNCIGMSGPLGRDLSMNRDVEKLATRPFADRINPLWEENVGPDLGFMTEEQVRKEIRRYVGRGVDFLKYASSGHNPGHTSFIVFSESVQKAIVEEGHSAGLTVQAHTTSVETLRLAIEAGVDLITHAEPTGNFEIPGTTISKLAAPRIPCGVMPKTQKRYGIEGLLYPAKHREMEVWKNNELSLFRAGVPLLINTDGGLWDPDHIGNFPPEYWTDYEAIIGEGYFMRIRGFAELGLSPMEIIQAGTKNVAEAYHKLDLLGTLEKGKLADLVILDADPLADVENIRRISRVIKDGRTIDTDRLPLKKILFPHQKKLFLP